MTTRFGWRSRLRRTWPLLILLPVAYALQPIFWSPVGDRAYNFFQSKRTIPPWTEVIVVGVDEATRNELFDRPHHPLSRHTRMHAILTRQLAAAGARAIVFDIAFEPENFADPPEELAAAFREAGTVYTVVSIQEAKIVAGDGRAQTVLTARVPDSLLAQASLGSCVIDVRADADGVVRRFSRDPRIDRLDLETLPERLAGRRIDEPVPIEFPSIDRPMPIVSYRDVVRGEAAALESVRGRIAFVGLVEDPFQDFVPVPRLQRLKRGEETFGLSGVVVLAAITETLLRGAPLRDAGPAATLVWVAAWCGLTVYLLPRRRPIVSAVLLLVILAAALVTTGLMHIRLDTVLPAGLLLGALLLSGVYALVHSYVAASKELLAEEMENSRVQGEMETARRTQERLLPKEIPAVEGLDLWGVNKSSLAVSGDYYDLIDLGPGRPLLVAIADVSGKGLPASLLMSLVHAALHCHTMQGGFDLARTAGNLNRLVCENTDPGTFVTAFLAEIEKASGRVRYVRAGHDVPVLVSARGEARRLEEGALFLGALPETDYPVGEERLSEGDVLCLYTDGVTEASDAAGEQFQIDRLTATVAEHAAAPAAEIGRAVVTAVERFSGLERQQDDVTLVIVKRTA